MTLQEEYQNEKKKPTPGAKFIMKIAEAAKVKDSAAQQWVTGARMPRALAREKIAEVLGKPVCELFPQVKE